MNSYQTRIRTILGRHSDSAGGNEVEVARLLREAPFELPAQYMHFLLDYHGVRGFLGPQRYVSLWHAAEALENNEGYMVHEFAPDIFLIGTDGGGTGYGIRATGEFIAVPLIGMASSEVRLLGKTFIEMLEALRDATDA